MARRALDRGDLPETGEVRPHVTVVVDLPTLLLQQGAGAAQLDRLGAICGETARRLACDAAVCRVITNGASQVLDVGRAVRTVTPAQRRALVVRDQGCVAAAPPPRGARRIDRANLPHPPALKRRTTVRPIC